MIGTLRKFVFAAVLCGHGLAVPVAGPDALFATTLVTTINGTLATIEATIDAPIATVVTKTVKCRPTPYTTTTTVYVPFDEPSDVTTFDAPIPTVVTTTIDGTVMTLTSTIWGPFEPPTTRTSTSISITPVPNSSPTTIFDAPFPTLVTTTVDGTVTTYTSTVWGPFQPTPAV